ncbi:hypothetical protein F8S20_10095 [Nostoc sp. BAE]|nr:hypothetical protein [Nostoc commune BAE]
MLSLSYLWEFKLSDSTVVREAWCTYKVYQPLGRDRPYTSSKNHEISDDLLVSCMCYILETSSEKTK